MPKGQPNKSAIRKNTTWLIWTAVLHKSKKWWIEDSISVSIEDDSTGRQHC